MMPVKRCVGRHNTAQQRKCGCDSAAASGQGATFGVRTFRFNKHDTSGTHRPVLSVNGGFWVFFPSCLRLGTYSSQMVVLPI